MMQRAISAGVGRILLPNVDEETWHKLPDLVALSSPALGLYPMLGIHPCSVDDGWQELWARMKEALSGPLALDKSGEPQPLTYVGIGEIGIDLYWRQDNLALQKEAFMAQVYHAIELDLPVCIHSRESLDLILDCTLETSFRGVYHCFGGTLVQARCIMDRGQYLGIGGTVTFKSNQALRDVLKSIGPEKVLMETDSPYLAPVPYRGQRNEPGMVSEVAQCLGEIWGMSAQEAGAICSRNATDLWGIKS